MLFRYAVVVNVEDLFVCSDTVWLQMETKDFQDISRLNHIQCIQLFIKLLEILFKSIISTSKH